MDVKNKELWDRLANESERAYRAFQTFLNLPSSHRTVVDAYREHTGNAIAHKVSDTFARWSREYAWVERARARDAHLDRIRRRGEEKAIECEAQKMAASAERMRGRFYELQTRLYEEAMERMDNDEFVEGMRFDHIIQIARLHLETMKETGATANDNSDSDWTEEDDEDLNSRILPILEAEKNSQETPEDEDSELDCSDEAE